MRNAAFFIFIVLTSIQMQAQLVNGTYTEEVDERLKNINKAPITSNILIDRVFPAANIQNFNQGTRIDTSNVTHFKQAWSELYRASYTKNFSSIDEFNQQLRAKNYGENVIPIGIINTEFHQSNFGTTIQNANIDFNSTTGLFVNKPNTIPFIKKQTTIISTLNNTVFGNTILFKTDQLFRLHKFGKKIKTLKLYTNNDSFTLISNYNLALNSFTTSYSHSGIKTLRFVITYNDNTTKITCAKVKVVVPSQLAQRVNHSDTLTIVAHNDLGFKGYDESQSYYGENRYQIFYDVINQDQIINKPIFIIDGYDPNDDRKITINNPYHRADKSIYELMNYEGNDLVFELQNLGYDVIIVNHPVYERGTKTIDGGSDYIERNAFTFISLLREINEMKVGNEENVVIGPSMGGLISRYALAYMEKKLLETNEPDKWNHETRLWVSFDSPHQGANIPIGVQKGIQYFANEFEVESAKKFINEELSKPAPKQMLVNHFTNNTSFPVGAPGFRNRFQDALNDVGMPHKLRKVALINGSIKGLHNGTPEAKYLEIEDELTHLSSFWLVSLVANVFADKLLAKFYHTTNKKSGSSSSFTFDGGLRGSFLGWSWWTTRKSYFSHPKFKGSYDVSPGGYFNAQQLLVEETSNPDIDVTWYLTTFHDLNSTLIDPTHCFIPTKSALDYIGIHELDEDLNERNLVCSNNTPFDSYFAPQGNEEHTLLTTQNVNWLKEEINGNVQPPNHISINQVFEATIVGPSNFHCYEDIETYRISIDNCHSTVIDTVNWTVSNNLEIVETNFDEIKVRAITSPYDTGTVTASYTVQGSSFIKHKQVNLKGIAEDRADQTIYYSNPFMPLQANQWRLFYLSNPQHGHTETWEWKTNNVVMVKKANHPYGSNPMFSSPSAQNSNCSVQIHFGYGNALLIKPLQTGVLELKIRKLNKCGCNVWKTHTFYVN